MIWLPTHGGPRSASGKEAVEKARKASPVWVLRCFKNAMNLQVAPSQWREYDNIDITDLHEVFSEHLVAGRKWGLNPRPARVIDQRLQKCQAE